MARQTAALDVLRAASRKFDDNADVMSSLAHALEGDLVLGEEALHRGQPQLHAGIVAEDIVAVFAEGRLQDVLGLRAAGRGEHQLELAHVEELHPGRKRRLHVGARSR